MLIWTDIETTGLDTDKDKIIEIAIAITDDDLKMQGDTWSMVIRQPVDLSTIRPEVVEMHSRNGLWAEVAKSKFSTDDARRDILALFKNRNVIKGEALIAGSSVHFDRAWLHRWMPSVIEHLNYRIIDVSTLKSLAFRWKPKMLKELPFANDSIHRAVPDVEHTIAQARFYREKLF